MGRRSPSNDGSLTSARSRLESLAPEGCGDATLLVLALRRVDILRELVAMGIEDAQANPEESLVAYENATREARLLAEP